MIGKTADLDGGMRGDRAGIDDAAGKGRDRNRAAMIAKTADSDAGKRGNNRARVADGAAEA